MAKGRFGKNPHLKVLAFTLTVVLYFFVVAEKETTKDYTVSVVVGHVPSGHVVLNDLPDLTVTVSGSARGFARLDPEALRQLSIDIQDPTVRRREIRDVDFGLPGHFEVETISPRWINVDVDELVERDLQVRPVVRGAPARGFEATEPVADPPMIQVSAPSSYFPDFDSVFTEGIDITGAATTVTHQVAPVIQRPFVTFPPDTAITITVDVITIVETRTMENIAMVITGPDASRCSVDVASISVTVTGPKPLVDELEPYELFAGVDCSTYVALGAGIYTPEPSLKNLARGLTVVELVPAVLQLRVEEPQPPSNPTPVPPAPRPEDEDGSAPVEGSAQRDLAP